MNFDANFVIFTRNIDFYNRINILKITLNDGVADIIAMETQDPRGPLKTTSRWRWQRSHAKESSISWPAKNAFPYQMTIKRSCRVEMRICHVDIIAFAGILTIFTVLNGFASPTPAQEPTEIPAQELSADPLPMRHILSKAAPSVCKAVGPR